MTNTNYYNWTEILSNFDDKELYSAFVDKDSLPERRETAERLLLERRITRKDSEGKYIKEDVEKKHLTFLAHNLKKESKEETIAKLIDKGLNHETAKKIVEAYLTWKTKKTKLIKPWLFIAPVLLVTAYIADLYFFGQNMLIGLVLMPFAIFFLLNVPTESNFRKKEFFKVLVSEANAEKPNIHYS